MNGYLKQYQKNEVETSSPEKILILLYDGAINFLNKAKVAIEAKDIQKTHNNIVACQNIIMEFMNTLDREMNPDLGDNLYNLYDYLYNTLVKANIQSDIRKVDEVLKHLKSLRETWQKAINIANNEKSQAVSKPKQSYDSFDDGYENDDDYEYDDDEDDDEYEDDDE